MAAPILSYEGLGLVQGEGWLFRGLDLHIGARDRLALIGRNGAGKTTLLKCIADLIDTDEGRRTIVPGTRVVLLEQDPQMEGYQTLSDWVLNGANAPSAHEADAIADQLGVDLSRPVETASGGERRRAAIARALGQKPDVLLLDEPTNHLDLAGIEWLEAWLGRFSGAFIAISHDRTFLARLTKSCLWLDRGQLRRAEIGFGGFEAWTEAVYAEEARAAEKMDAKLKLELHWLQRGVTARRRRNQGRLAKLNEMRAQRAAMLGTAGTAKLAIGKDDVRSKAVIEAEHVAKGYDGRAIIRDFTLWVQGGTLFLDEVGDIPLALQVKLLRFLQERVIERIGGRQPIPVDTRIVCATHQDLEAMIASGRFREDLYYRLAEVVVKIPSLAERPGDSVLLARHFANLFAREMNPKVQGLSPDALAAIDSYAWPGNVRELENRIKRAVIMTDQRMITAEDLDLPGRAGDAPVTINLRAAREVADRRAIRHAMSRTENNISGAAKLLGISRPTLYDLLKQYQLQA